MCDFHARFLSFLMPNLIGVYSSVDLKGFFGPVFLLNLRIFH